MSTGQADIERVTAENQWLRERLAEADARIKELETAAATNAAAQPLPPLNLGASGRDVATCVLELGGYMQVMIDGAPREMKKPEDIPSQEFPATAVKSIHLGGTQLSDEAIARIAGCKHLAVLDIARTKVTDSGFAHIANLTELETLFAMDLQITEVSAPSLGSLHRLRYLDLSGTKAGDACLAALVGSFDLENLQLAGTLIHDAGLKNLEKFQNIMWLNLGGTDVTDNGLPDVAKLPRLRQVLLENCHITDAGLRHLHSVRTLRHVVLRGTGVTRDAAADFKKTLPGCGITATPQIEQYILDNDNEANRTAVADGNKLSQAHADDGWRNDWDVTNNLHATGCWIDASNHASQAHLLPPNLGNRTGFLIIHAGAPDKPCHLRRTLAVPSEGMVRVAIGAARRQGGGWSVLRLAANAQPVWERYLVNDGWFLAKVDLSKFAGQTVELDLACDTEGEWSCREVLIDFIVVLTEE